VVYQGPEEKKALFTSKGLLGVVSQLHKDSRRIEASYITKMNSHSRSSRDCMET